MRFPVWINANGLYDADDVRIASAGTSERVDQEERRRIRSRMRDALNVTAWMDDETLAAVADAAVKSMMASERSKEGQR